MTIGDTVSRFLRYDADIAFRSRARTLLEFLDPQDGDLVLDAGCGLGFYLVLLSKLTPCTTVGIEVNNSRLRSAGAASPGSLLAEGDITRLPFPDSTFDKVLSSEVLEHCRWNSSLLYCVSKVIYLHLMLLEISVGEVHSHYVHTRL